MKEFTLKILNYVKINKLINNYFAPFILLLSVLIIIIIMIIFVLLLYRERKLMSETMLSRAKDQFSSITITRKWNAEYGGVYVEKKPEDRPHIYVKMPEIHSIDNKVYILKNPAIMTREISHYTEKSGSFLFNITSLKPLNPNNKPDDFEKKALAQFENGLSEYYSTVYSDEKYQFRYMAPLKVEKSCLKCHSKQGYKVGDTRGGISVTFDITNIINTFNKNKSLLILLSVITLLLLLGVIGLLTFFLMRKLSRSYEKIDTMATIDDLTQIYNRRYFFPRLRREFEISIRYEHPLSCILIDIDDFKNINDTFGHQAGDIALFTISHIIKNNCRKTDVVARFGGEEFIILLPETTCEDAVNLAEKIRKIIYNHAISHNNSVINMTISLGASGYTELEIKEVDDINDLIKRADKALYNAKEKGKNRVEIYSSKNQEQC